MTRLSGFLLIFLSMSICANPLLKSKKKKPQKPKNVILLIGDGMGVSQIYAGITALNNQSNFKRFKYIGFSQTQSSDNYITDSAAGATALSTGKKTYNGAIALDNLRVAHPTLLELAEKKGKSTGLVATCAITHATPAAFIAHQLDRKMEMEIALDFLKTDIDVVIGGGQHYFNERPDGKNLIDSLKKNGYQVYDSNAQVSNFNTNKYYQFKANYQLKTVEQGRGNYLETSSEQSIQLLSSNKNGYFLMIEGSQIDWGGHENNSNYIIKEQIDFDITIGKILDWAMKDKNTLVIVTADHETGGYALNQGSMEKGTIEAAFTTKQHTGVMVPVFAYGPGAEQFMGIYENTSIFDKIKALLDL